jgi:UDP-glucuronate decarboxylase
MRKVLITGGSGFIGSQCIPLLLNAGCEVHAITSRAYASCDESVYWHRCDLLSPKDTAKLVREIKAEYLLHLAWYVEHGQYLNSKLNETWLEASLSLAREFAGAGGRRAVAAGTCFEYARSATPLSESSTPIEPASVYARCKHSLNTALVPYFARHEVGFAWGRVFYLYGPGEPESRLVPYVIRSLLRGERAVCRHGSLVRDFLHVRDVAGAFVRILLGSLEGSVNIGAGRGMMLQDFVSTIGEQIGAHSLIEYLEDPTSEPTHVIADISRLRETGFVPALDTESGIADTIRWWRERVVARGFGVGIGR